MWITIVVTTPHHKHVGEASMNIVDSLVLYTRIFAGLGYAAAT